MPHRRLIALAVLLTCVVGLTACQAPRAGQLDDADAAYQAGRYQLAYETATPLTSVFHQYQVPPARRNRAALVAGLSAQRLGKNQAAAEYLEQASKAADRTVAGNALAALGLLHAQQHRYAASAKDLLQAADYLEGQDSANAWFYAAAAQQKLGWWTRARTNLLLARRASRDPAFRQRVNQQLQVTGYTVQVGAFADQERAKKAAEKVATKSVAQHLGRPRILPRQSDGPQGGQQVYLVQVGQFATYQSAAAAKQRLATPDALVAPLAGK